MKIYRRRGTDGAAWWGYHYAGGKAHRKSMQTADKRKARARAREWAARLDDFHSEKREEIELSTAIAGFLEHCRLRKLSVQTIRSYEGRLRRFLAFNGDEDVSAWAGDDAHRKLSCFLESRMHEVESTKHDRVRLSAFFNFMRAKRWYRGENPADAKLHFREDTRGKELKQQQRTLSAEEDMLLRKKGQESILWPILLLTRWVGLRRGEACTVRWSEVNLDEGYLDVTGHEWGRKHPRRVRLAPWVVLQLRMLRPARVPGGGAWPVWPYHIDRATKELKAFCEAHGLRRITFNGLRATFVTECFRRGMTPLQESRIAGHGVAVAERHYSEYQADEARWLLPGDPLTEVDPEVSGQTARTG